MQSPAGSPRPRAESNWAMFMVSGVVCLLSYPDHQPHIYQSAHPNARRLTFNQQQQYERGS